MRTNWWGSGGWRWVLLAGLLALAASLPAAIAALPVSAPEISPDRLLARAAGSEDVAYSGVVESSAHMGLPDFRRAERLAQLLGEKHRLRVWYVGPTSWRVDEITSIGERDTYLDGTGLWLWDSGRESVTRVKGTPAVRFLRPADLLPSELGRRVALAADATEIEDLPARRVAGVACPGLRIVPRSDASTIGRVDMWVHPNSGLPLAVEIVPRGTSEPLISSQFLDLELGAPSEKIVGFDFPEGASFSFTTASDFAQAVERYSPFVLPNEIGGLRRRSSVAGAAATFGDGFELVAALVLSERYSPFTPDELARVQTASGSWGTGHIVETPLFNALTFRRGGIRFILGGTVTTDFLDAAARSLASEPFEVID
jgi:outer membrane lipoprotein-sorting protein